MRFGALLAAVVWGAVFGFGAAMVLRDLDGRAMTAVALSEFGAGVALLSLAVLMMTPRFRRWRREPMVVVLDVLLGALLGALGGLAFTLGWFLPYLAGWGGHELSDLVDNEDFTSWQQHLKYWAVPVTLFGSVVGALCGVAAWVVRFAGLSWRGARLLHKS